MNWNLKKILSAAAIMLVVAIGGYLYRTPLSAGCRESQAT